MMQGRTKRIANMSRMNDVNNQHVYESYGNPQSTVTTARAFVFVVTSAFSFLQPVRTINMREGQL